jgi:hypothetical protein
VPVDLRGIRAFPRVSRGRQCRIGHSSVSLLPIVATALSSLPLIGFPDLSHATCRLRKGQELCE